MRGVGLSHEVEFAPAKSPYCGLLRPWIPHRYSDALSLCIRAHALWTLHRRFLRSGQPFEVSDAARPLSSPPTCRDGGRIFVDGLGVGTLRIGFVLQKWSLSRCCRHDGFISFNCVHCGAAGYVHDHGCAAPDPVKIARFQAEAAEHARIHKAERLSKGALAMVTARRKGGGRRHLSRPDAS